MADWDSAEYPYPVPQGLQKPMVPSENPVTDAKVKLGKLLYFDKRLSADGTISCATCHDPKKGWTDQAAVSTGIKGQKGNRNSPTVLNTAYLDFQFWDGRAPTLEEQAKGPIANSVEMASVAESKAAHDLVVKRLRDAKGYRPLFDDAFGKDSEITIDRVAQAIATFERTALTGNSPYDRYEAGDKKALSAAEVRGKDLFFGKASCSECHTGFNFTDSDFHNLGVGMGAKNPDLGRYVVTKDEKDRGAFKTPTLRNLASTFPYMHDGSQKTLKEVVEFYNQGGEKNPWLSTKVKVLNLTDAEKNDLIAFMGALNGDPAAVDEPSEFPK